MKNPINRLFVLTEAEKIALQKQDRANRLAKTSYPHMWFWRLRTRTALRSKIIERRATPLNFIDESWCDKPSNCQFEQFIRAQHCDHIAETAPSALLMHMARHEASQRVEVAAYLSKF